METGNPKTNLSENIKITRDKFTKQTQLHIKINTEWELYGGPDPEDIDRSHPMKKGSGPGIFPIDTEPVRYYFELETKFGNVRLAETLLPMEGCYNLRDLGGIRNKEGRFVKWGKLFRSDDLCDLTKSDLHYLESIPIHAVIDFRSKSEAENALDKLPGGSVGYSLPFIPGDLNSLSQINSGDLQLDNFMHGIYKSLVSDSACIKNYRDFFSLLQEEKNIPLIFHCSAGKDRTGMAAVFILSALDVDKPTIMHNYLLSNCYLADKYEKITARFPNIKPLFEVKPAYLENAFSEISAKYGSMESFLTEELHIHIPQMKTRFLY